MLEKTYPAKVLLLGEYTILSGSRALAVPFESYAGRWSFESLHTSEALFSSQSLNSYLEHGLEDYIDKAALQQDVAKGLWFDSSIPHGYGVGSSGALIAAIFDRYGRNKGTLHENKLALARLEDFFHGASSGIDPLVSLVQKPLLIHDFNKINVWDGPLELGRFFLIDSGAARQTGPLVQIYQEKIKDVQFKRSCLEVMTREVDFAIDAMRAKDGQVLFHHLWHISKLQWDFFQEMIPTQMRGIWTRGLDSGEYILKLCGAGGGGFLLGFSLKNDLHGLQSIIKSHELKEFV
jgi:mevalonate kinase